MGECVRGVFDVVSSNCLTGLESRSVVGMKPDTP
jgi:hypothetical protein